MCNLNLSPPFGMQTHGHCCAQMFCIHFEIGSKQIVQMFLQLLVEEGDLLSFLSGTSADGGAWCGGQSLLLPFPFCSFFLHLVSFFRRIVGGAWVHLLAYFHLSFWNRRQQCATDLHCQWSSVGWNADQIRTSLFCLCR